jgi:hypothetical protein
VESLERIEAGIGSELKETANIKNGLGASIRCLFQFAADSSALVVTMGEPR